MVGSPPTLVDNGGFPRVADGATPQVVYAKAGQVTTKIANYFPGSWVTFLGSFIGLGYGFVTGFVSGTIIGWLYNTIVSQSLKHEIED